MVNSTFWKLFFSLFAHFKFYTVASQDGKVHFLEVILFFFSLSLNFILWSLGIVKSTFWKVLFLFFKHFLNSILMIRFYLKISEMFVPLNIQDGVRVVNIPFVRIVKFQFLEQFPVDLRPHPFVSHVIPFGANLLHLVITWLIVLSLSPHSQHLLFSWFLSFFPWT